MNYDVSKLSREQLIQISIRTADNLRERLQTLEDNFQSYSENYTDEALALLHSYHPFADAVKMMYENNEFDRLDTNGLREMAKLSLRISKAYRLLVFTPDDQKEYDETIAQFKKDVYAEANKRLQENKTELVYYRKTLLCELGNKEGEHLKPVYEYFNLDSEYWYNDEVIKTDTRKKIGNPQSRIYRNKQILEEMQNLIKTYPLVEFLQHYRYDYDCNTLRQGINDLCDRIGEAQKKVQERLDKEKYPIWELTPVIAGLFANNEFYTEERQEYICDWVSEQERIDELVDVFKNAIPVALSILAFFMPAGIALIVQIINTAAGAAATIEDIQQATNTKELVYSQYNVSYEAEKVLTEANLSQAEFNLAMAVFSGVFVVADFADTIKLAKKLGIGDQVMRLFAKGTATKEEIHELVELTAKNQQMFKNVPKSNGTWSGTRGNSKWIPDKRYTPKKFNKTNKTWEQILNDYDIDGIKYTNGYPDFSPVSKGNVEIKDFSAQRYGKGGNFDKADIELARIRTDAGKPCTADDVTLWREQHKYTWHEEADCKSMKKVPLVIHGNMSHNGGISTQNKMKKQMSEVIFDD